jgi:large subunit ribosomal protein L10
MQTVTKDRFGRFCKERMIEEVLQRFKESSDFVVTSYAGSSVSDLEQLRRSLKKVSADYVVVKNSNLKIILEKLKLESEIAQIEGGMGVSLSGGDIVSTCNVLVTFAKSHDKFKIKSAVIDGRPVTADKVKALAALPPRKVLLAQVVGTLNAPIAGFVTCLGGVIRKFVYCVGAIKTSRENIAQAAPAAPAEPETPKA